jgi:hypothetical protein
VKKQEIFGSHYGTCTKCNWPYERFPKVDMNWLELRDSSVCTASIILIKSMMECRTSWWPLIRANDGYHFMQTVYFKPSINMTVGNMCWTLIKFLSPTYNQTQLYIFHPQSGKSVLPVEVSLQTDFTCKIWGFHGGDYEEWSLLGCYAEWLL